MKNFRQKIAYFLEALSRKIDPSIYDSTLKPMDRKTLIFALQKHQYKISELELRIREEMSAKEDVYKKILEYIDYLGEVVHQGDLSKRLELTCSIIGTLNELINLTVQDLSQAVKSLPPTHPLYKKYLDQGDN